MNALERVEENARAFVGLGIACLQLARQQSHFGLRLFARHARFQTPNQFKIRAVAAENVRVTMGHHVRYPDVVRVAHPRPLKPGGRDTYHSEVDAIQLQTLSHAVDIAVEAPAPEAVAQNYHRVPAGNSVLIRHKETTE